MAIKRLSNSARNGILAGMKTDYDGGIMELKTGTMPTDPEAVVTDANLAAVITVDGLVHTPGSATNGLTWEAPAGGELVKTIGQTWKDNDINQSGVITHAILYDVDVDKTAAPTGKRIILDVATSGASVTMANTSVVAGGEAVVSSARITCAAS